MRHADVSTHGDGADGRAHGKTIGTDLQDPRLSSSVFVRGADLVNQLLHAVVSER